MNFYELKEQNLPRQKQFLPSKQQITKLVQLNYKFVNYLELIHNVVSIRLLATSLWQLREWYIVYFS